MPPIPALPLFKHRDTVVTPADQNQFVTQFETTMDTMSNDVIPAINDAITDINAKVVTATTARDEAEDARDIAVAAKDEALTAVATLQEGAIDDTTIALNKAFSNQYIENNYYNKTEVDTAISDANQINTLPDKPTPVDTDNLALQETGGLLKKLSWENLKATLLTYFGVKISTDGFSIKNASGGNIKNQCTAWVVFDGTTTPPTIKDSYNVSSVVRTSTGQYDINFSSDMDNNNYSFALGCSGVSRYATQKTNATIQKISMSVINLSSNTYENNPSVSVNIFGGKN